MAETGVAKIENESEDPIQQWKEWFDEVSQSDHLQPNVLSIATCTKEGRVSCRSVVMRRQDPDGFVIVTDSRSKKAQELEENPTAAIVFFWTYIKGNSRISRQVRMEGTIKKMAPDEYVDIYKGEPLFCKIRAHACHQGQQTTWQEQKDKHDKVYERYTKGDPLPMPDHFVGYKFTPNMADFYHAYDNFYADRLCYLKEEDQWSHFHINA